jgi:hypothetical protein
MHPILRVAGVALGLAVAACKSIDLHVPVVEIPPGSDMFVMDPGLLNYHFIDSSGSAKLELTWLPLEPYAGSNCLALLPSGPGDTVGTFVFGVFGANVGRQLRIDHGTMDTTAAIFLSGHEGTHGSYVAHSNGSLNLNWADASPGRSFFDAAAAIRLHGDTIASDIFTKASGDSVSAEWHVRWLRGTC